MKAIFRIATSMSLAFSLSACSTNTAPNSGPDLCKEVLKITGRYTDITLNNVDLMLDGSGSAGSPEIAILGKDLRSLAKKSSEGDKRDLINALAKDFENLSAEPTSTEYSLALVADLQVNRLRVICPK